MNANEVIANRGNQIAGEPLGRYRPLHPNDHVNRGQSSNDVFPAVMHLATLEASTRCCSRPIGCAPRSPPAPGAGSDLPMIGRTHLQDATPIMLGDVVAGWSAHIDDAVRRVDRVPARALCAAARRDRRGHRHQHPSRVRRAGDRSPGRDDRTPAAARPVTSVPPWRRTTRWRRPARRCAPWPARSSRSPTTSGSTPRDRAPGSANSSCRPTNPDRRSCPAR